MAKRKTLGKKRIKKRAKTSKKTRRKTGKKTRQMGGGLDNEIVIHDYECSKITIPYADYEQLTFK